MRVVHSVVGQQPSICLPPTIKNPVYCGVRDGQGLRNGAYFPMRALVIAEAPVAKPNHTLLDEVANVFRLRWPV